VFLMSIMQVCETLNQESTSAVKVNLVTITLQVLNSFDHLQWCSVCNPAKISLTSKFTFSLFPTPPIKSKTGTANRWETSNKNSPGPIKLSSQSTAGVRLCCSFLPASASHRKMLGQSHFAEPNQHVSTFLLPIFFCWATYRAQVELLLTCVLIQSNQSSCI
jgi:hypothetical protein